METYRTLVLVALVLAYACQFERDSVAPGYYGQMEAGSGAGVESTVRQPVTPGTPSGAAGSGPSASPSGSAGSMMAPAGPGSGGSRAPVGMPPASVAAANCDLSGRWLVTMHLVLDALGELQYTHYFHYFEIEQSGASLSIAKGLLCGFDSVGLGAFTATANFRPAWAATMSRVSFEGMTGTSAEAAGGCKVDWSKWYTVRGATVPHYTDPSNPLPTAAQRATDTTPGWEDWDGDGNPGLTGMVSGIVSGKLFVAPRMWTQMSGTVSGAGELFKLPTMWNQEQNVMSYDGTPLLGSESVRASDAKLHFTEFARLRADQATGDDAAICRSVVELAPTLTPAAAAN